MPVRLSHPSAAFGRLLVLLAILGGAVCSAAELRLKNGSVFHGEIVSADDRTVVINVSGAEMSIPRKEVELIVGEEPVAPPDVTSELTLEDVLGIADRLAAQLVDAEKSFEGERARHQRLARLWAAEDELLPWARAQAADEALSSNEKALKQAAASSEDEHQRESLGLARATLRVAAAEKATEALRDDLAEQHTEAAVKLSPDALSPHLTRARRNWRRDRPDLVVEELHSLFQGAPDEFLKRGDNAFLLLRAYRDAPKPTEAVVLLALLGKFGIESPSLDNYVDTNRTSFANTYLAAARLSLEVGETDDAKAQLARAIELQDGRPDARFEQAVALTYYSLDDKASGQAWEAKAKGHEHRATAPEKKDTQPKISKALERASESNLGVAVARASREGKQVLIFIGTTRDSGSQAFLSKVFSQPSAQRFIAANFIWVMKNAETGEGRQIAMQLRVAGFPSFIVLDAKGREVFRQVSAPSSSQEFMDLLEPAL